MIFGNISGVVVAVLHLVTAVIQFATAVLMYKATSKAAFKSIRLK